MAANNLAARAGRWSAEHWARATLGWFVFVLAAIALGTSVGNRPLSQADSASGETARVWPRSGTEKAVEQGY